MSRILFLHTSPAHIPTFDTLLAEIAPSIQATHVVDERLLQDAREGGITSAIHERVGKAIQAAATTDTALVVCTCSTLGGVAEQHATADLPIVRVDRAMAELAVATGSDILVVAALASTLVPTRALLEQVAADTGRRIVITEILCETAWPYFAQGDLAMYHGIIAESIRQHAEGANVVVLAQASMAGAAALCADLALPILSSPRLAVEAAVRGYAMRTEVRDP
jgi:hypothetical protein